MTPRPTPDPDLALETARDLLTATVCACGHCDYEHQDHGACLAAQCPCVTFQPVAFTVTRA